MTLDDDQAKEIIKHPVNAAAIAFKQEKSKLLKAHVTGQGDKELITQIKGFERKEYADARKDMRMSNVDVIARVMMPRNKIYYAKGGIEAYTIKPTSLIEDYKVYLSKCCGTQSLKEYIESTTQPCYDYDPEGLLWLELNNYSKPYPCFKSIMQIHDYELSGRIPEYVAFALTEKEIKQLNIRAIANNKELTGKLIQAPTDKTVAKVNKVFRVVCDTYDRIITYTGQGEPEIVSRIMNPFSFMGVPGMIVSNIVGNANDMEAQCFDSPLQTSLNLLTQLIFSRSFYNVAYVRHTNTKEWMQAMPCPTCINESGEPTGLVGSNKCPECKGSKVMPAQLHSDTLVVDFRSDESKSIPRPPMGHDEPAVEMLQFMKDNNFSWEDMFNITMWGTMDKQANNLTRTATARGNVENTAYQAQQNEQPLHDKLTRFSAWYSGVYKWYAEGMGRFLYRQRFIDCGFMGGQRFMIESADATFDRLLKARTGGATKSELDSLTLEYIENKYPTDPIGYRKFYILFIAEPFYHDLTADVLTWDIPMINKMEKIFFDEWTATLNEAYFAMVPDDGLEQKVKDDLRKYTLTRIGTDTAADTLLFTAQGSLLAIGDSVMVKKDGSMTPSHLGQTFNVKAINGRYATLEMSGNNADGIQPTLINGYSVSDLIKN